MEIITGYTGESHVTSADDASLYRGIIGIDDYVLSAGSKFQASIIDNNTVRIMDGDLLIQGHQARIRANDYNEVTIDNGTPGQKRNDLIVARYLKNTETGIESIALEAIKGTPGASAVDPEIIQEDLKTGGTQRDYPLYRVVLDGISLTSLTTLFNVVPTFKSHLAEKATDVSRPHGLGRIASQDYEEGIFTPTVTIGGAVTGITYSHRLGFYSKVGRLVTVHISLGFSSKGTASGAVLVDGLPFRAASPDQGMETYVNKVKIPSGGVQFSSYLGVGSTGILVRALLDNNYATNITDAHISNDSSILITGTYFI